MSSLTPCSGAWIHGKDERVVVCAVCLSVLDSHDSSGHKPFENLRNVIRSCMTELKLSDFKVPLKGSEPLARQERLPVSRGEV